MADTEDSITSALDEAFKELDEVEQPEEAEEILEPPSSDENEDEVADEGETPEAEKPDLTEPTDEGEGESDPNKTHETAAESKPPEHVPYGRFQKVRLKGRQHEREIRELRKQLEQADEERQKFKQLADEYGFSDEIDEPNSDPVARIRQEEGESTAMLYQEIKQTQDDIKALKEPEPQPLDVQLSQDPKGQEALDNLSLWKEDAASGDNPVHWQQALQIEQAMLQDPQYANATPSDFYTALVENTESAVQHAIQQSIEASTTFEAMPESLSSVGDSEKSGNDDLFDLEGEDFFNALYR